jgi:sugar phosphate isomerase/epimerase
LKGFGKARVSAVAVAAGAILSCTGTAQAQRPADLGAGAPTGQMGVQLYDWSNYISSGAGEITCPAAPDPATPDCVAPPAPSTSAARLERTFKYLQSKNVRNVELYNYPGAPFPGTNPATPLDTAGLRALRDLGDSYGLRFVSRHGNLSEANWDQEIAASKILGQEVIGAADPPNAGSSNLQQNLTNAQMLNRLGKRSVEGGVGPAYFHNHASAFDPAKKTNDGGVMKTQWQFLMDHTDPRYVRAQIDLGWAVSGQQDVTALMNDATYSSRVISFHVKDVVNPQVTSGTSSLRALGDGDINFAPMFAAAKNKVRYYLYEYDPVTPGQNGGFNPFTSADKSFAALTGDAAPVAFASTPAFSSVPMGTPAANNAVPVKVTNIGDAPLVFTNAAPTLAANADDGGNATRDDFSIVSQDCQNKTLAPAKAAVADDPATTDVNESAPAVGAGTCTVNVGFKPSRTSYTSVARLVLNTNGDDAMDRVNLYGTSTGDAIGTVGGIVPSMLALTIPTQPGSFGTFQPTVAKSYETAVAATVTSTAGDATLSVTDPGLTAPGHLTNGAFSLPSPLNARAQNAANAANAYAPLAEAIGAPLSLLTYTGPTNVDPVTIGFRQAIGAGDVLRSGSYSKTLTFTLSTTAP